MKNKNNKGQRLSKLLDIPLDVVADVPRITLSDNSQLTVENYKNIESYQPEEICLRSKNYRIFITGNRLQIVAITDEEVVIQGIVTGLSLR